MFKLLLSTAFGLSYSVLGSTKPIYSANEALKPLATAGNCETEATTLHLSSPPFENYFYSDCNAASQLVITSPLPNSNLDIIKPRVLVAWPAGNSGIVVYFKSRNPSDGVLELQLVNSTGSPLLPVYQEESASENPTVGISVILEFNKPATLSIAVLGSIRTMRDYVEGGGSLQPEIQNAIRYSKIDHGVEIGRVWLDGVTKSTVSLTSTDHEVELNDQIIQLQAGKYVFNASFNYPQLIQLNSSSVLSPGAADLISKNPLQTASLSFLSYTTKLTAGAWRFLTYFGRDTMIAALLLQPVLSEGEGGAIEAVLSGVLERINIDGSACHEEIIGDYATWLNLKNNVNSSAALCDYKMVGQIITRKTLLKGLLRLIPISSCQLSWRDILSPVL